MAIGLILVAVPAASEQDPPLICFGNEPSWSVSLMTPDTASLSLPGEPLVEYRGGATKIEVLPERIWRGRPADGADGDLVVFLRDVICSDGMSNVMHPVEVRLSLPDGRVRAGCCRIPPAPAAARPISLEGRGWRLVALREQDEQALGRSPHAASLRFEAGRLEAFGGCNTLVGSYDVEQDHITLGTLAGTLMACEPAIMAVETAFREALAGTLRFEVAADRLTFTSPSDGEPMLVFEAVPPPTLEGVDWEVTGFNNGRQAVVGPHLGTRLSLRFEGGSIVGHAGCNGFHADYSLDGNRIVIGPAATTRKACAEAPVMEQEREFLAALESATVWTLDPRGMLDVHRADGERVLTAHPRTAEPEPSH